MTNINDITDVVLLNDITVDIVIRSFVTEVDHLLLSHHKMYFLYDSILKHVKCIQLQTPGQVVCMVVYLSN